MNYSLIKWRDIADGPGIRVSLFVSGCRHHCKGCFNPETWSFDAGKPYTPEVQKSILAGMALALGKSETTVKHALSVLVQQGLIVRVRQGVGRASRIYVKIIAGAENDPYDSQKTAGHAGEILPTNKNIERKMKKKEASERQNVRSYDCSEEESL